MPEQVIAYLDIQTARLILEASAPDGQLIAIDRDAQALDLARQQLAEFGQRVQFFQRRFSELPDVLTEAGPNAGHEAWL